MYALLPWVIPMVYGIIKLLNFAHGDIFMVGSFVGYYIIQNLNLGLFPTIILTMIVTGVIG